MDYRPATAGTRRPATSKRPSTGSSRRTGGGESARDDTTPPPTHVGHYLIGKTVGQGTFGSVKLGTHIHTGEAVAVKVLDKSRIKEIADVTRVTREIKIFKKVAHPFVCKLYEVCNTKNHILLVSEYATGGELFGYIVKHGRLRESVAARLFAQLVEGVDYLHQVGVCHRDLKPENILLAEKAAPDGGLAVKIIDFGLSNTFEQGSTLTTACGSPAYASPSMIMRVKGGYNPRKSDIWSLGVVLFAMVAGCLPFEHENTAALYDQILNARYRCPSHLSPACRDLIARILIVDPRRRYGAEEIRRHPWMRTASGNVAIVRSPIAASDYVAAREAGDAAKARALLAMHNPRGISEALPAVMRAAEGLGISMEQLQDSIRATAHNAATAAYHLLLRQALRRGDALSLLAGVGGSAAGSSTSSQSSTVAPSGNGDTSRTRSVSARPQSARRSYVQRVSDRAADGGSSGRRSGSRASGFGISGRDAATRPQTAATPSSPSAGPKSSSSSTDTPQQAPSGTFASHRVPTMDPTRRATSQARPRVPPLPMDRLRPTTTGVIRGRGSNSTTRSSPRRGAARSPPPRRNGASGNGSPHPVVTAHGGAVRVSEAADNDASSAQMSEAAWAAREAQFETYEDRKQRTTGRRQPISTNGTAPTAESDSSPRGEASTSSGNAYQPRGAESAEGTGHSGPRAREPVRPKRPTSAMRPSTAQRRVGAGARFEGESSVADSSNRGAVGGARGGGFSRSGVNSTRQGTVIITATGGTSAGGSSRAVGGSGAQSARGASKHPLAGGQAILQPGGSFTARRAGPDRETAAGSFLTSPQRKGVVRRTTGGPDGQTSFRGRSTGGGHPGSGAGVSGSGSGNNGSGGGNGGGLPMRPNSARSVSSGRHTGPLDHLSLLANRQRAPGQSPSSSTTTTKTTTAAAGAGGGGGGVGSSGHSNSQGSGTAPPGSARRVVPERSHRGSATSGNRDSFASASTDGSGGGGGMLRRPSVGSSKLTLGRHGGYEYVRSSGYGSKARRRQSGSRARSPRPGSGRRPQSSTYTQPPYDQQQQTRQLAPERPSITSAANRRQVGQLRAGGRLGAGEMNRPRSVSPRPSTGNRMPNAGQQARFRGKALARDVIDGTSSAAVTSSSGSGGNGSSSTGVSAHARRPIDAAGLSPRAGAYASGSGGYGSSRREGSRSAYGPAPQDADPGRMGNRERGDGSTGSGEPGQLGHAGSDSGGTATVFVPTPSAQHQQQQQPYGSVVGPSMVVQQASSGRVTYVYARKRPVSAAHGRGDRPGSANHPSGSTSVAPVTAGAASRQANEQHPIAAPDAASRGSGRATTQMQPHSTTGAGAGAPRLPQEPGYTGPDRLESAVSQPAAPIMPRRPGDGSSSPNRGAAAARGRRVRLQVGTSSSDTHVGPSSNSGAVGHIELDARAQTPGAQGGGDGAEAEAAAMGHARRPHRGAWHGSSDASLADDEADESRGRRGGRRLLRMTAEPSMEAGDHAGDEGEGVAQTKAPGAARQHSPSAAAGGGGGGGGVVSASGGASTGSYTAIGWTAGRHSNTPPTASAHVSPPSGGADAKRNPHRPTTLPSRPAGDSKGMKGDVSPARRAVLARNSGGGTGATGVNPSPRAGGGFRD